MTEVAAIYPALQQAQKLIAASGIGKDANNAHDSYRYRSIDAVYNRLGPIHAECGIAVVPTLLDWQVDERQGRNASLAWHRIRVQYDFVSTVDGSRLDPPITTAGEAIDRGDKGYNKALSAAYKYALFEVYCIPFDVPDADAETLTRPPRQPETAPPGRDVFDVAKAVRELQGAESLDDLKRLFSEHYRAAPDEQSRAILTTEKDRLKGTV